MSVKVFVIKPKHIKNLVVSFGRVAVFFSYNSFLPPGLMLVHFRTQMNLAKIHTHSIPHGSRERTYITTCIQFYCACAMIKTKHQSHTHTHKKNQPGGPGPMFNDGPRGQQPPQPPPLGGPAHKASQFDATDLLDVRLQWLQDAASLG